MSTLLEESTHNEPTVRPSTSPSQRLRITTAAARVSLRWLGVRKTLTAEQKTQAADTFGAEGCIPERGLYNAADYPETLVGLFELAWDYPSVEPPPYLQQLSPDLYRQECERVQQRYDEAVRLAEQAFLEELQNLIAHLNERLAGQQDGKSKVFRDTAIENLVEFFERFRRLNVRSNEQLDEVVDQARQIVQGVAPQSLRENHVLRQSVTHELSSVQIVLDELLIDRPRRNILRRPR